MEEETKSATVSSPDKEVKSLTTVKCSKRPEKITPALQNGFDNSTLHNHFDEKSDKNLTALLDDNIRNRCHCALKNINRHHKTNHLTCCESFALHLLLALPKELMDTYEQINPNLALKIKEFVGENAP